MKQKIIYTLASGQITSAYTGPDEFLQAQLTPDGAGALLVDVDTAVSAETHYVLYGKLEAIPNSPGDDYVFDYDLKQWVLDANAAALRARAKRNRLLAQSDWTQLPDVPLETKSAWAEYRQALRDITEQSGYPFDIVWPTPPQ